MDINLFVLLFTIMVSGISYSLPVPLFPVLSLERGFSESYVGLIFSIYSISNILAIPFINQLINYFKRFDLLIYSCLFKVCLLYVI